MDPQQPAVVCSSCERTWNSAAMVEGLRLLSACPRCGGDLRFAPRRSAASAVDRVSPEDAAAIAPHLVLGIPRR